MLLGADRTRNNGILIYLFKVTKVPKKQHTLEDRMEEERL